MGKEKSEKERQEKKEKKEKKEKRSEKDGVHKSKKDKKEKKVPVTEQEEVTTQLLNTLEETNPGTVAIRENGDVEVKVKAAPLVGALVPFANPLADEKVGKKVLKSVKKGKLHFKHAVCVPSANVVVFLPAAKNKSLKRGVKEVVKSLRKSQPATSGVDAPGVVILAADISPMDVISHIPVLCEDHGVPYLLGET